jgi:hypothetical protein
MSEAFEENFRPICINHGCEKPVTFSHKNEKGNRRWRIHCGHCQGASYGRQPHAKGVTPYKTGKCTNVDGHLGFLCWQNWGLIPMEFKGRTEVDHKDGDHTNNNLDNLDELCGPCHKYKGQLSGDFKSGRYKDKK